MKLYLLKEQMMSNMVFEWIAVLHQIPRHAERPRFFPNVSISSVSASGRAVGQAVSEFQWISPRKEIACCMVIVLLIESSSYGQSSCSLGSRECVL